jgi:hypothetical protein
VGRTQGAPFAGQALGDPAYGQPLLAKLAEALPRGWSRRPGPASLGRLGEEDALSFLGGEVSDQGSDGAEGQPEAFGDLPIGLAFEEVGPADLVTSLGGRLGLGEVSGELVSAGHIRFLYDNLYLYSITHISGPVKCGPQLFVLFTVHSPDIVPHLPGEPDSGDAPSLAQVANSDYFTLF